MWLRQVVLLGLATGGSAGLGAALFLPALALVGEFRTLHGHIVWALPLAGYVMGRLLSRACPAVFAGSDLVIEQLHGPGSRLPLRLAPAVLLGTLTTHLCGGSAGREGTAVQMGASLADAWAHRLGPLGPARSDWLRAGVAAGFAAVFGTPLAAVVFAVEFFGRTAWPAMGLLSACLAAFVADAIARLLGAKHVAYPQVVPPAWCLSLVGKWLLFSVAVAAVAVCFVRLLHWAKGLGRQRVESPQWRMAIGGGVVVGAWQLGVAGQGLGLGLEPLLQAFGANGPSHWLLLQKLLLTVATVGAGFPGGEVTPLFLMGASLGHELAPVLDLPLQVAAAAGMLALYAGAANAPLTMTAMAFELFGSSAVVHVGLVCLLTCALRGPSKLYRSQKVHPWFHLLQAIGRPRRENAAIKH